MLSMYSKAILAFLAAFWTAQPIASQNITKVMVENISCDQVIVVATIDPVSSTYTFSWVVSINGGKDIELALVGLNGIGGVLVRNSSKDYTYNVKNDPSFLISGNNPFTSRITFTFTNKAFENLIFRTISTPLNIPIPNPVNAPTCQGNIRCGSNGTIFCSDRQINGTCMASNNTANLSFVLDGCDPGCQEDITCEDGSSSCTRCGSNVPRIFSCPNSVDRKYRRYCECNETKTFVQLQNCDPGCQEDITCEDGSSSCTRCGSNVPRIFSCPNPNRPTVRRYCECNETNIFVQQDCDPGCEKDITCEDGSSSCTRCDNKVPRIISCANGQTVKGYCKCNGITAFVDEDCPPGCQICGIIILCIGGLVAVIGISIMRNAKKVKMPKKRQKNSSIRGSGALAAGVGFCLCGIALIAWRPADGGFIGGGIAFIIVALRSVGYGICACRQKEVPPKETENNNEYENNKK